MLGGYGAFAGNVGYNFIEGFCFNAGSRLLDKCIILQVISKVGTEYRKQLVSL